MIYQNKTNPQNLFLEKQKNASLLSLFTNYDKHKIKKKASLYFRVLKKQEKRLKAHKNKQTRFKTQPSLRTPSCVLNKLFVREKKVQKQKSHVCKFYAEHTNLCFKRRRLVGYSSHGDTVSKHF